MSTAIPQRPCATIEYPDSDGQPIAENTLQFQWIVTIKENLEALFRRQPDGTWRIARFIAFAEED